MRKIGPVQIVAGIILFAWVAWMISVETDYEESWDEFPVASAQSASAS
jgi:hypothetical protein